MTAQRLLLGSAAALALAATAFPAAAGTLQEALHKAYQANPTLTGARSGQRALDEGVAVQKASGRPSASAGADYTETIVLSQPFSPRRNVQLSANVSVPLYSGGAVKNGVKAAATRVEAGRADLRATEASVFTRVVAAYMDVISNTAIVSLNLQNVKVLDVNLQATNDRFEVGDLTRTDIAQSESRLALARSDLQTAQSNLIAAKENYIALVGDAPGDLEAPPELPGLPATPDTAVQVALSDNPDILSAKKDREAAIYDVKVARAGVLPTIAAVGQASHVDYFNSLKTNVPGFVPDQTQEQAFVGAQLNLPLYQGGRPAALVRQSQARESQAIEAEIATERGVISQARAAYASWQASLQTIQSSQKAVDAAALSLEGVRAENTVGSRTILDILNAEQEALIAKVQLVSARRNAYVAAFSLLAAMGHAEARDLGLESGSLYDPITNYNRIKGKWWDWDFDPKPTPVATRTVDTPAQNAIVAPATGR